MSAHLREGWRGIVASKLAAADLVLYHGTLAKHVPAIRQEGLKPPIPSAQWYMLTTSKAQAAWYVKGRDDAVVLEYRVPSAKVFRSDDEAEDWFLWPGAPHINSEFPGAVAHAVKGTVPSEYLVAVHPVKK